MGILGKALHRVAKTGHIAAEVAVSEARRYLIQNRVTDETLDGLHERHGVDNYAPVGEYLSDGDDYVLTDRDGKPSLDFQGAYSANNQGHGNPRIVGAIISELMHKAVLSRAWKDPTLPLLYREYERAMSHREGIEGESLLTHVLPMNTGAEAVETVIKMAQRWAQATDKLEEGKPAKFIVAKGNFHGRTQAAIGASSERAYREPFGTLATDAMFEKVDYGTRESLEQMRALLQEDNHNIAGIYVEPLQGEGGMIAPYEGYYRDLRALCDEFNVLMMTDEVQAGLGRTGYMLATDYEGVEPDIVSVGKAWSGGVVPASAALMRKELADLIEPGMHGSTFGGYGAANQAVMAALKELVDRDLCEEAQVKGAWFQEKLREIAEETAHVEEVRGRGMMIGIKTDEDPEIYCEQLRTSTVRFRGGEFTITCHDAHGTIRISPPLTIPKEALEASLPEIARVLGHPNPEKFRNPDVERPESLGERVHHFKKEAGVLRRRASRFVRDVITPNHLPG